MTLLSRYISYLIHHQLPGVTGLLFAIAGSLVLYLLSIVRIESFVLSILGFAVFLIASLPQFRKYEHQQEITLLSDLKILAEDFGDHSVNVKSDSEDVKITKLLGNLSGEKIGDEMLSWRKTGIDTAEQILRVWYDFWKQGVDYLLEHPKIVAKEHLQSYVLSFWFVVSLHFEHVVEKGIKLMNDGKVSRNKTIDLERFNNYKTRYNYFALKFTEYLRRVRSQLEVGAGTQSAKTIDKDLLLN
jgi:hypothetical protein